MLKSKSIKFCVTYAKPPPTGSGTDPEDKIDLAAAAAPWPNFEAYYALYKRKCSAVPNGDGLAT